MVRLVPALAVSAVLFSLMLVGCSEGTNPRNSQGSPTSSAITAPTLIAASSGPTATPSFDELKGNSTQVPYNDLFRNNNAHVGKQVWYRAKVVQVIEGKRDEFQLRANVTEGEYSWDDTVFLSYRGPRVLEDDVIEFVGIVEELISYEAVFGQDVTIPAITVVSSQLVAERGQPVLALAPTILPQITPMSRIPTPGPTAVPNQVQIPTPTPVPTSTPVLATLIPTPAPTFTPAPTPTPTPLPPGFTINNPVNAGGVLKGADGTEIVATAIVENAWELIHTTMPTSNTPAEANRGYAVIIDLNPPAEGNRFYMVTVDMAYNAGEGSKIVEALDFRLLGKNRLLYHPDENSCGPKWTSYDIDIWAPLSPLKRELFIGGKTWGNICFEISEDESNLLLVHRPESETGSLRFLALDPLKNGSPLDLTTILVEPHPDSVSLPPGFTLDDPVEAGGIMEGTDGTGIVATAIVEDAWELIRANSSYEPLPPAEGKRFYMVTVEVAYDTGEGFLTVDKTDFGLTGDHRAVYVPHWDSCGLGVTPDELEGELFIGAKIKGNLCFQIPESDSNMILIHQPGASGRVNTWSESWHESRRFLSLE